MDAVCPWDGTPLPSPAPAVCPNPICARPLVDEAGRPVRDIDVNFDRVRRAQDERFRRLLQVGTPVAMTLFLPLSFLQAGGAVLLGAPACAAVHLVVLRLALSLRSVRLLSRRRRMIHRWLTRLGMLLAGGLGYSFTAVPVGGVLLGGGVFVGLTFLYHRYTLWTLREEKQRRPLRRWEVALVVAMAIALAGVLLLLTVLLVILGWTLERVGTWLR